MSGYSSVGKEKVNLFEIATSELSQDAFLVWLISYADERYNKENADEDNKLHKCAKELLLEFLQKNQNENIPKIKLESVERQVHNIDILVKVEFENTKYAIVIEDKTFTSEHDNQLENYKGIIENPEGHYTDYKFLGIYYKLGFQSDTRTVVDSGYNVFGLKQIRDFFNNYDDIDNTVFSDYKEYVSKYKDKSDHTKVDYKDWTYENYCSFYEHLRENLKTYDLEMEYDYIHNVGGGFCGAWITGKKYVELNNYTYEVYLQMEPKTNTKTEKEEKEYLAVCLKMGLDKDKNKGEEDIYEKINPSKNRDDFIDMLDKELGEESLFRAPKEFGSSLGSGNTMTIKIYKNDDLDPKTEEWEETFNKALEDFEKIVAMIQNSK